MVTWSVFRMEHLRRHSTSIRYHLSNILLVLTSNVMWCINIHSDVEEDIKTILDAGAEPAASTMSTLSNGKTIFWEIATQETLNGSANVLLMGANKDRQVDNREVELQG